MEPGAQGAGRKAQGNCETGSKQVTGDRNYPVGAAF